MERVAAYPETIWLITFGLYIWRFNRKWLPHEYDLSEWRPPPSVLVNQELRKVSQGSSQLDAATTVGSPRDRTAPSSRRFGLFSRRTLDLHEPPGCCRDPSPLCTAGFGVTCRGPSSILHRLSAR